MKKVIRNAVAVGNIPVGYSWESEWEKIGFFQIILFAFATGDWNPFHINPLIFLFFESNLGGMTCPGDMVLALTKKGVHKIFKFEEPTEIISSGYKSGKFKRALRVGRKFRYTYTLVKKVVTGHKSQCTWKIQVWNDHGKEACFAIWQSEYMPICRSDFLVKISATAILALWCSGVVWLSLEHPITNNSWLISRDNYYHFFNST